MKCSKCILFACSYGLIQRRPYLSLCKGGVLIPYVTIPDCGAGHGSASFLRQKMSPSLAHRWK